VNRQELEKNYEDFETFDKKYNPSKEMDKLIEYAEQEGLSFDKEQWEASKLRIELLFKAYIARDLWDAGKFYQIYNESDPIYQKAKEILKDPSFYVDKI
jgi:carboxyl-terminal processing protease